MGKLIFVDEGIRKTLDGIRRERGCSYSKAIAVLAAEKGRTDDRKKDDIETQIVLDLVYYRKKMPNIKHELEILGKIIFWLWKTPTRKRKEIAGCIRDDLEEIVTEVMEEAQSNTKNE